MGLKKYYIIFAQPLTGLIWTIFLNILDHFVPFLANTWSFLVISDHFGPFLVIFGHFGHFWPFLGHFRIIFVCNFLPFWGQLIQCWYALPNLDHFRGIFGCLGPFCAIFGQFGLCFKALFKWYLCLGGVVSLRFDYNVVHLFPCIWFQIQYI